MGFREFKKEMKVRGFTQQTIESYLYHNHKFLKFIGKSTREVNREDIKQYLGYLVEKRKAKPRTVNLAISALKFYYEQFSNKKLFSRVKRSKEEKLLPRVLSKEEILRMINAAKNPKHKLLIELMYSSGLRVSECVRLKIGDIDIERKIGIVRLGKGKKDRLFLLSNKFLMHLDYYLNNIKNKNNCNGQINNNSINKNKYNKNSNGENNNGLVINENSHIGAFNEYLFNNGKFNGHITIRTAERIIKNAAFKAGINKRVHCHMLRASFATHLLEEGVNESYIQKLMGHESKKTLQRYLAVRVDEALKVKSPLDNI